MLRVSALSIAPEVEAVSLMGMNPCPLLQYIATDVIAKLGTKEVLYTTRDIGWGCDTHLYRSAAQMREALPARLTDGARVVKQLRGKRLGLRSADALEAIAKAASKRDRSQPG